MQDWSVHALTALRPGGAQPKLVRCSRCASGERRGGRGWELSLGSLGLGTVVAPFWAPGFQEERRRGCKSEQADAEKRCRLAHVVLLS